jgi:hypothetical protein
MAFHSGRNDCSAAYRNELRWNVNRRLSGKCMKFAGGACVKMGGTLTAHGRHAKPAAQKQV